jgi:Ca-activated chloride channel family protein
LIQFSQPLLLLLLLALPVFVWRQIRRRRAALRFPDTSLLKQLPAGRSVWVQRISLSLSSLAVAALIIAVAGPRWPDPGSRIPAQGISIGLVLDVSGSMAEEDLHWQGEAISRLEAVKKVFRLLVAGGEDGQGHSFPGRSNDQIALTVFATRPDTICPLTLSHSVLLQLLDSQQPRTSPTEARTNIGDALAWSLDRLPASGPGEKILVLFTDGEHNVPAPALTPRQAAQLAGNLKVPIYVIDAGKETAANGPEATGETVNRQRAKKMLQEVAEISKGRYFEADSMATLLEVTQEIDQRTRAPLQSYVYRRYHEGFTWFALAAFLLLILLLILETTVWRRIP